MDNSFINAASQLYMAGLGHLVIVSNGQLLNELKRNTCVSAYPTDPSSDPDSAFL